ncbi:outer membrane protein transport protein [Flavobacterium cerinum]|uniref:Outer membrane protein transport protein n=1 Tax=Flavobacterium cerinum TaxID=2502784 RepID=A0ABY5ISR1_9FLAO|nr:outer membrane protein transport protein [Flavobacterium cerinum]UUC45848.1 outer membrane protein transport protein [Flavobacterium cerinum]
MIKKIILGTSLLFSSVIFAQEGTASPYSFYGIGDVKYRGTHENKAMGGLGVLPDSIHLNLQNPASLSGLIMTTFTVGATNRSTTFKTDSQKETASRTTFDYLALGFPISKKMGVSFGLMPYSSVGYKVDQNTTSQMTSGEIINTSKRFTGEGGVNNVFFALGYKITPKLSIGADFQYNFGRVETKSYVFLEDVHLGKREINTSRYSGVAFNAGLMYQTKVNNKYDWYSSLTYSPQSNLRADNTGSVASITYSGSGAELESDVVNYSETNTDFKLPAKYALGTGFGLAKKWMIGAEVTLQDKSSFVNRFDQITNVGFEKTQRYVVGGYFIPKFNSFTSYLDRVTYRAGFRYENTGLVINNQSIKDYSMNAGLGLPIGRSLSNLNIGFEYGKRGTASSNLVQENYFGIYIGLSVNDLWFRKTKYE